jgi:hypothetical protein
MPNIMGNKSILLQPGDTKIGITIRVKICSTATANDGYIPFGTTVESAAATVYFEDGTVVTSGIVYSNPTVSGGQDVRIELKYPTETGEGRYKLSYLLQLSDGATKELDFNRIVAKNL